MILPLQKQRLADLPKIIQLYSEAEIGQQLDALGG